MQHVSRGEYIQIVQWIKNANNYRGITPHDVEGVGYCLEINGKVIEAAWEGPDDFCNDMIYLVHKDVYRHWKDTVGGYNIVF
jgi:hypothetical protein